MGISTHGKLGGSILTRLGKNQKEGWKMKKGMSLVLALVMCLSLCACGKNNTCTCDCKQCALCEQKTNAQGVVETGDDVNRNTRHHKQ